ncbi:NAD-dependent epimerase/dehydratase family protein [bacterium]|nr:NAD-dependent epimerase/dehydratase family protein [bacterium]
MSVLVTGGAGFVGSHLVKLLLERGEEVRVLVRPTTDCRNLKGCQVQYAEGDLRNIGSLCQAVRGCRWVFHCAADYRLWAPNPQEIYEANVQGTINLLEACRQAETERIIVTSSVAAVGIPGPRQIGDEDTPVSLKDMVGHYKRSKFLGEQAAMSAARSGLPVVVVNPSTPIGDFDSKPTATGKIITDFLNGKMPAYVQTGLNLVDVRDVAYGHILAAERGQIGRRYILGGEDMTLKQILDSLSAISGLPKVEWEIPLWVAYGAACIDTFFCESLCHCAPHIPLDGVKMARKHMFFSWDRAKRELGYSPGSAQAALERAVQWYMDNGYAPITPQRSRRKMAEKG